MWGNCLDNKGKITLNFYLYQAGVGYIEYVLLHELIHFIHRNHTQQFYDVLSIYMPDWKERKETLDPEIISGIQFFTHSSIYYERKKYGKNS